jgi:hypothetical protein
MNPITKYVDDGKPGSVTGNQLVAKEIVRNTRIMIQLTLIKMSIPAILPMRNEPGIESSFAYYLYAICSGAYEIYTLERSFM